MSKKSSILHALKPALFGSYTPSSVNALSVGVKPKGMPRITFGVGLQQTPAPENIPDLVTHPPGWGKTRVAPGFSVRIGGGADSTDPTFKAIASHITKPLRGLIGR